MEVTTYLITFFSGWDWYAMRDELGRKSLIYFSRSLGNWTWERDCQVFSFIHSLSRTFNAIIWYRKLIKKKMLAHFRNSLYRDLNWNFLLHFLSLWFLPFLFNFPPFYLPVISNRIIECKSIAKCLKDISFENESTFFLFTWNFIMFPLTHTWHF